jgi:hypothetical protein
MKKTFKPIPSEQLGKIFRIRDKIDGHTWVRYWGTDPVYGSICEKSAPVDIYLQEFPGYPIEVWDPWRAPMSSQLQGDPDD